jgi:hypothetical protein
MSRWNLRRRLGRRPVHIGAADQALEEAGVRQVIQTDGPERVAHRQRKDDREAFRLARRLKPRLDPGEDLVRDELRRRTADGHRRPARNHPCRLVRCENRLLSRAQGRLPQIEAACACPGRRLPCARNNAPHVQRMINIGSSIC